MQQLLLSKTRQMHKKSNGGEKGGWRGFQRVFIILRHGINGTTNQDRASYTRRHPSSTFIHLHTVSVPSIYHIHT